MNKYERLDDFAGRLRVAFPPRTKIICEVEINPEWNNNKTEWLSSLFMRDWPAYMTGDTRIIVHIGNLYWVFGIFEKERAEVKEQAFKQLACKILSDTI